MVELSPVVEPWTLEELLALLGTSKKRVITSQESLEAIVALLNGAEPSEDDPAHPYDEIALRCMVGLLAGASYRDDVGAAGVTAWTVCLPGFLRGKNEFLKAPDAWLSTTVV